MGDKLSEAAGNHVGHQDASEIEGRYLTFWINGQLFGIPIAAVVQIVGVQPITEVPDYPSYAKGIINMRGSIIPIIDVRLRLGKPAAEYNDRTCIIVTNCRDKNYGLVVDEVEEVADVADDRIAPPPKIMDGVTDQFITGIGKMEEGVVLLIDAIRLLGNSQEDENEIALEF